MMRANVFPVGLVCAALFVPLAMAQTPPPPQGGGQPLGTVDAGSGGTGLITQPTSGVLRVSGLIGTSIVDAKNEGIGEIADVLVDPDGRISSLVVQVDTALGFGGRKVVVPISAVRIDPYDTTASTGTIPGAGLPASTAEGQESRARNRISNILAPRRIALTMSKDQLQALPAFEGD